MTVFQKLNLKDQDSILVLDAPASFEAELKRLTAVTVHRAAADVTGIGFFLAFVTSQPEADKAARTAAKKTVGDAVVWLAYPKGSSKRYTSSINRDSGWKSMGEAGFEPVRMVAIDEDWSGLRFRRVDFIKTMTRGKEHALTPQGREKAGSHAKPKARR